MYHLETPLQETNAIFDILIGILDFIACFHVHYSLWDLFKCNTIVIQVQEAASNIGKSADKEYTMGTVSSEDWMSLFGAKSH